MRVHSFPCLLLQDAQNSLAAFVVYYSLADYHPDSPKGRNIIDISLQELHSAY